MVKDGQSKLQVGDVVLVPWGLGNPLKGKVLEVWGDAAGHVRIKVMAEGAHPMFLLLRESWLLPAA
jgi:hypothetical protein